MNSNSPLAPNCVIPAQAGIQMIKKSPAITSDFAGVFCQLSRMASSFIKRDNIAFVRFAGCLSLLDSRLRGNDGQMDYLT